MLRKIKSHIAPACRTGRYRISHIAKELFSCLLSAVLLILSFPKFNFEFLAWFGFVPLFFALKNKSKFKAFLFAYLSGAIFWLGTIYWLVHVTLPGMLVIVLYLALYFGIFGLLVSLVNSHWSLVTIPSIWVLLEYVRSHLFTGFPWALLGYSQYLNLPVIQIADITGVWGVSFLVMMVNVAVYSLTSHKSSFDMLRTLRRRTLSEVEVQVTSKIKKSFMSLLCIIVTLTYGYYKLYHQPKATRHQPIKISVIQGNIPQELKWNPGYKDFIIDKYLTLTSLAVSDKPDLIIWPEAALSVVLEEEPLYYERVRQFSKEINTPMLLGAVTARDNLYYNSAILISSEGKLLNKYNKLHLVPFGEYIPLRKILGFLETIVPIADFTAGKEYTVFDAPAKFSVLICFEDLFPELSRGFVNRGADFLMNITNDAWFKKTSSPYQHLCASVFRAVENRIFLVRSANTGVSGFIAPSGKIISLVSDKLGNNTFISGYKTSEIVILKRKVGFYTRYGDIFVVICLLFILFGIILYFKRLND